MHHEDVHHEDEQADAHDADVHDADVHDADVVTHADIDNEHLLKYEGSKTAMTRLMAEYDAENPLQGGRVRNKSPDKSDYDGMVDWFFKNNEQWELLGVQEHLEQRSNGKWYIKPTSTLPRWLDRRQERTKTSGLISRQTARQKEAMATLDVDINSTDTTSAGLQCYHCGVRAGTAYKDVRGKVIGYYTARHFQFDGMKPDHVLRKYNGRAPSGKVKAGLEVANEDAVIRCTECHAMKGPQAAAASSSLERDSGDEGTSLPELDD